MIFEYRFAFLAPAPTRLGVQPAAPRRRAPRCITPRRPEPGRLEPQCLEIQIFNVRLVLRHMAFRLGTREQGGAYSPTNKITTQSYKVRFAL